MNQLGTLKSILLGSVFLSQVIFATAPAHGEWNFLGVTATPDECRVLARNSGFTESLLSGWVRPNYYCCYGSSTSNSSDALVALTVRVLDLVNVLRPVVDPEYDYVRYLLPIKVSAERALALAKTNGPSSQRTLAAIRNVQHKLFEAEFLLSQLLRREDQASHFARELISIEEEIDNRLR